ENMIVYLETGSGKTLIAIMLLRSYACHFRKPSPYVAVFVVPKVVLVSQQAKALRNNTNLKVGMYWGDMGIDHWDGDMWKEETEKHEVLVMTPAILISCLRHSFIKLNMLGVIHCAEFIAAASSACQGIWLSRILAQIDSRKNSCITIYCDNSSSIKLSKNPVMHGRSKHIDVRFHFLRDLTKEGAVQLVHCSSFEQVADIMTKALSFESFSRNRDKLGLFNLETVN
ncbi:endoribonuclease dicer 2-like protein, partial [Trifolium pratense]